MEEIDDKCFAEAQAELEGSRDDALWYKCLALCAGDEAAAQAKYLEIRARRIFEGSGSPQSTKTPNLRATSKTESKRSKSPVYRSVQAGTPEYEKLRREYLREGSKGRMLPSDEQERDFIKWLEPRGIRLSGEREGDNGAAPARRAGRRAAPTIIALVGFVTLAFVVFLSQSVGRTVSRQITNHANSPNLTPEYIAHQTVKGMLERKRLPMTVDESTVLDILSTNGKTITYSYKVSNVFAAEISEDILNSFGDRLRKRICKAEDTAKLLLTGVTLRYVYRDRSDSHIRTWIVDSGHCN